MKVGYLEKQPGEIFPVWVDVKRELAAGESLTTVVVTARDAATGQDTSSVLLQGAAVIVETRAVQMLAGGNVGDRHIVQFDLTTSAVPLYKAHIEVAIVE
jgi:hypothetical protein